MQIAILACSRKADDFLLDGWVTECWIGGLWIGGIGCVPSGRCVRLATRVPKSSGNPPSTVARKLPLSPGYGGTSRRDKSLFEVKFQKVSKSSQKFRLFLLNMALGAETMKVEDRRLKIEELTANYAKYPPSLPPSLRIGAASRSYGAASTNPESFRGKCFLNRIFALGTGIFAWFVFFAVRLTRVHTGPSVVLKIQSILYIRSKTILYPIFMLISCRFRTVPCILHIHRKCKGFLDVCKKNSRMMGGQISCG
jgi:hypothetical protein